MPAEVFEGKNARVPPPATPLALEVSPPPMPPDESVTHRCANCLTPLAGPFCAQCGQHVADYHRSVWRFVADFFDNAFCWDNKLFRTLDPLIKRPGFLTQEFMAGRRVRYVHPLRLFLFTSAICLALLQYTHHSGGSGDRGPKVTNGKPVTTVRAGKNDEDADADDDEKPAASPPPTASAAPAPTVAPASVSPSAAATATPAPSAAAANTLGQVFRDTFKPVQKDGQGKVRKPDDPSDKRWDGLGDNIQKKIDAAGGAQALGEKMTTNVQQKLSWVALAMLPIFALLLRAAFGRQGGYYFTYLVFSLHYHTFLLLFWVVYAWVSALVSLSHSDLLQIFTAFGLLVPPWYLFRAFRQLFGQDWKVTGSKVFAVGAVHLLTLFAGLGIIGATSFL